MKPKTEELFVLMVALALCPEVSFADTRAGGEGTTANVTLDIVVDEVTDVWDVLESEALTLTSTSQCIVTACSDVANPGAFTTNNNYNFVISRDDTSPGLNTVSERSIEFHDNTSVADMFVLPVCSTLHLSVPSGAHTIYWLGAKASASDLNTTVLDTTMTIGCFPGTAL